VAYICGAEVFWRMSDASIFWEFGKYTTTAILGIAFLRSRTGKGFIGPFLYMILLTLSVPLTISSLGLNDMARQAISFNLSGPLSLAICILYFSQINLHFDDLIAVARIISLPLMSILTLAGHATLTAESILFMNRSNFITSGGFGPNQVSAVLGLGVLLMFLMLTSSPASSQKSLTVLLCIAFGIQATLTFSRGGLYNAAIGILVATLIFIRTQKSRTTAIFFVFIIITTASYIIYPQINNYTDGMLGQRFTALDFGGRIDIAGGELTIFKENPLWGIGPGMASFQIVRSFGVAAASHTEYTRLLAEHGLFGLLSMIILFGMILQAYLRAPDWLTKGWVIGLVAWCLAEMSHAGMRIVAVSFLLGLIFSTWQTKNTETVSNRK
jgi:hypothetical protein